MVRTRMAPSPSGKLHIGTAYATIWPYVYARHESGVFILRIEDTDQKRSTKEFEENIIQGLKLLGFEWDEGPYHQMDHLKTYQSYAEKLLENGKAYYCFCSKEELDTERKNQIVSKMPQVYSGKCRNLTFEEVRQKKQGKDYVVRFKMPDDRGKIEFDDLIHGKISFDSKLIGDMVLLRSSGSPLYNFAVVVDDIEMKISHIIRGDDHISNTPKQLVLYEAIGVDTPKFAHYPMILNQDRIGKLSKRTGSTSIEDFLKDGFLPEALFNYIASLGWNPAGGREIFTKEELIKDFAISDIHPQAAAWNEEKLEWMNGEYIRSLSDEELLKRLQDFLVGHPAKEHLARLIPLVKSRIKKLSDFIPLTYFIFESPEYDLEVFQKIKIKDHKEALKEIAVKFQALGDGVTAEAFEKSFRELADRLGVTAGEIFQLIRVAISGQLVTPPLFEIIYIIGYNTVLERINKVASNYPNFNG